jgi:hypothetical protein
MHRSSIVLALVAALALAGATPAQAASVSLYNVFPSVFDPSGYAGPNSCVASSEPFASCLLPIPGHYAWISAFDSGGFADIAAHVNFIADIGGDAEFGGTQTLLGGVGAGFAEFQVEWSLTLMDSDSGSVTISGPGISESFQMCPPDGIPHPPGCSGGNGFPLVETGSAWSAPIPMIWGTPFSYDATVSADTSNVLADAGCCVTDLSITLVGWQAFDSNMQPILIQPEPATFMLMGSALLGLSLFWRKLHAIIP